MGLGVLVAVIDGVGTTVLVGVYVGRGVSVAEGVAVAVSTSVTEGDGAGVLVAVADGVAEDVGLGAGVGGSEAVGLGVSVAVGLAVGVEGSEVVGLGVSVADAVGPTVGVGLGPQTGTATSSTYIAVTPFAPSLKAPKEMRMVWPLYSASGYSLCIHCCTLERIKSTHSISSCSSKISPYWKSPAVSPETG